MTNEVAKEKITVICNNCGKQFITNIGWAAKRGKNLTCSKCSGKKTNIEIGDDVDVNGAKAILKEIGIKIV